MSDHSGEVKRSNRAIAISGCFLHQSLMADKCETAPAVIKEVVNWAIKNEIGLIPWTCPETSFAGLPRKTKGIEGYRKQGLSETCDEIANSFSDYLQKQIDGGISIIAIMGVSYSPACSAARQAYHANEQGLFIQALNGALARRNIEIPIFDLNRKKAPSMIDMLDRAIEPFLFQALSMVK